MEARINDSSAEENNDNKAQLSEGVSYFVESMGLLMERYGLPRIGGRIMGLLMLDDQPLSLDDISQLLGVSRASVSTNLRMTETVGIAVKVAKPGDRRDYYVGAEMSWTQVVDVKKQESQTIINVARKALAKLSPDEKVARQRLEETVDFYEFLMERFDQILVDWYEHRAKTYLQE